MNTVLMHAKRKRTFSLRILLVGVFLLACGLAFCSSEYRRQQQINAAITRLRAAGAIVYLHDSKMQATALAAPKQITLWSILTASPTVNQGVELSDPRITERVLRDLIPDLRMQIAPQYRRIREQFIMIDLKGNPNIEADLAEEVKRRLPNCRLNQYRTVSEATVNEIKTGMSMDRVIDALGKMIYERQGIHSNNMKNEIRMLGIHENAKYTGPDGQEIWTYFTDEFGVGTLGIEFDASQNVADVWLDRGISKNRNLTEVFPTIGGL